MWWLIQSVADMVQTPSAYMELTLAAYVSSAYLNIRFLAVNSGDSNCSACFLSHTVLSARILLLVNTFRFYGVIRG